MEKLENIFNRMKMKREFLENLLHAAEAAQQILMFFNALQWRTKVQKPLPTLTIIKTLLKIKITHSYLLEVSDSDNMKCGQRTLLMAGRV